MKQEKKTTSIKIVLFRAKLIFSILLLSLLFSYTGSIYAGFKSGEINNNIINPTKKMAASFKTEIEKIAQEVNNNEELTTSTDLNLTATSSSNVKIKTNVNIKNNNDSSQVQRNEVLVQPPVKIVYPTSAFQQRDFQKEYEEALRKQEEWSAQKSAENQKWFEEQTAKNEAESKAWFDQRVAESQKNLEQWKKDNGF